MKNIERKEYLNTLIELKDKNLIKVLTGVRGSGKSTIMEMFRKYLFSTGVEESQIVF